MLLRIRPDDDERGSRTNGLGCSSPGTADGWTSVAMAMAALVRTKQMTRITINFIVERVGVE